MAHTSTANRGRIWLVSALVLALAVLAGVVAFVVSHEGADSDSGNGVWFGGGAENVVPPTLADVKVPAGADASGGLLAAGDNAAGDVVVRVYYDAMCPWCARFEATFGPELMQEVAEGGVTVWHHPVAFLDRMVGGTYSTRASNALAWVSDQAPDRFLDFVDQLMTHQPPEDAEGLSDQEISHLASVSGVPQRVIDRFTETHDESFTVTDGTVGSATARTFASWVLAATNQASADLQGLSTPAVLIDGDRFDSFDQVGSLSAAIDAIRP